jgi:uncharacterized protein YjbI with pentapeptide repeats
MSKTLEFFREHFGLFVTTKSETQKEMRIKLAERKMTWPATRLTLLNLDIPPEQLPENYPDFGQIKIENLSLSDCEFDGLDLSYIDLSGCTMKNVRFNNANLERASLSGGKLQHVEFRDSCMVEIQANNCEFDYVGFCGKIDLQEANFDHNLWSNVSFFYDEKPNHRENIDFSEAKLTNSTFIDVEFKGRHDNGVIFGCNSNFAHTKFIHCQFSCVGLHGANLTGTILTNSTFKDVDLRSAITTNAQIGGSEISVNKLMFPYYDRRELSLDNLRYI